VSLTDTLPPQLELVDGSVTGGATASGNTITLNTTLPAAEPADVMIEEGTSPAGGYLPLSGFGTPPIAGMDDETIVNFTVPSFSYGGETYSTLGIDSNGYVVVGGGDAGDNNCCDNQNLPDPERPNNVLAPFWTDLNPGAGGAVRIDVLTDGADDWIIVDWEGVPEFGTTTLASFQIWIGVDADANPAEDISFAYGPIGGNGAGGFLTVGAENRFGNRGATYYFNGTGTLPAEGTQLRVTTTPGQVSSSVVTFQARGVESGVYVNYAELTSPAFDGVSIARFRGRVRR
jgi:hypothetical protein